MSWVLVFVGFSLLIVLHELGHFLTAKATGMRVEKFFLFFPPKLVSVKRGETEYGIGAIPIGGYVKISGMNPDEEMPAEVRSRGYYKQQVWKRVLVIGAGPLVNIVVAFALFSLVFLLGGLPHLVPSVGKVLPRAPAAKVLHRGDVILAVDGRSYRTLDTEARLSRFGQVISSHKCAGKPTGGCRATTPVRLRIERGGAIRTVTVRPAYEPISHRTRIGIAYGSRPERFSIGTAAARAGEEMWTIASKTASVFAHIFEPQQRKQLTGIVGISDVARQSIDTGALPALFFFGFISFVLGLINLLPLLPLDGGHIFWSVAERLRGRPIPFRVMERASMVGIVVVAMLAFIGLSNDIGRLSGEGFKLR